MPRPKKAPVNGPARTPTDRSMLAMTEVQAKAFLLKPESYCRVELPRYLDFGQILRPVEKMLSTKPLSSMSKSPRGHDGVNYTIYSNKDGKFAWRPFQLIHPALYVDLTHKITEPAAWSHIKSQFILFASDPKIRCLSIPHASSTRRKDQASQILRWWQGIEQASIDLALDYNHVYHADITDCYASIYTHSIAWAMHTKAVAKSRKRDDKLIGNLIDSRLQDMQQGQTNGIPQGSVLVDLLAEMVLGFADYEVSKRLQNLKIVDFQVLRYRDDYRIFVNGPQVGEEILKVLTEVLMELGLKLHGSKTTAALPVIQNSIKPDKKKWMRSRQWHRGLQKTLMLIHCHATEYPNAGSVLTALDDFYKRLVSVKCANNIMQLISITVDIGLHSPRCFPVCAAIISSLLSRLATKEEKQRTLERVRTKLGQLPNNGHLEVWQQRLSYNFDPSIQYKEGLCQLVEGKTTDLWSNDWVTDKSLKLALDPAKIVDQTALNALKSVVPREEYSLFSDYL